MLEEILLLAWVFQSEESETYAKAQAWVPSLSHWGFREIPSSFKPAIAWKWFHLVLPSSSCAVLGYHSSDMTSDPRLLARDFAFLSPGLLLAQAPAACPVMMHPAIYYLLSFTRFYRNSHLSFGKINLNHTCASWAENLSLFLLFSPFKTFVGGGRECSASVLSWVLIMLAWFTFLLSFFSFCFLHSSHWRQWAIQRPELPSPLPARQPPSYSNLRSGP